MRRSNIYISAICCGLVLIAAMLLHARHAQSDACTGRDIRGRLVQNLRLTDLCLVTEARYTRHPAMADLHAPFQDHPAALEHFPSGALLSSPPFLRGPNVPVP